MNSIISVLLSYEVVSNGKSLDFEKGMKFEICKHEHDQEDYSSIKSRLKEIYNIRYPNVDYKINIMACYPLH